MEIKILEGPKKEKEDDEWDYEDEDWDDKDEEWDDDGDWEVDWDD